MLKRQVNNKFGVFINRISISNQTHNSKPLFSFMSASNSNGISTKIHSLPKSFLLYNKNSNLFWPKTFSHDRNGVVVRSCFESHDNKKRIVFAPQQKRNSSQLQLFGDLEIGGSVCEEEDEKRHRHFNLANGHGGGTPLGFSDHQKVAVAVDVDEVLGNFISALNRFIADRYSSNHSVSEYHVYEFFRIWNCTRGEADIRVHEFFKTHYFKKGIHPIPGARKALHQLSRFCNLSVVTSRQNAIKDHTIQWIDNYYPGLFKEIHFGNHFALDGESKPKSEICRSLGAKVLIDDNPRYALECAEIGIRVLLFDYENSYPWCKMDSVDQHPLITKVHNWEEVEHRLVSWITS